MKSEIIPLIQDKMQGLITDTEVLRAIEDLTVLNLIIGAKAYNLMDKHLTSKNGNPASKKK